MCVRDFIATSSMYALSCIRGNKVFELELQGLNACVLVLMPWHQTLIQISPQLVPGCHEDQNNVENLQNVINLPRPDENAICVAGPSAPAAPADSLPHCKIAQ